MTHPSDASIAWLFYELNVAEKNFVDRARVVREWLTALESAAPVEGEKVMDFDDAVLLIANETDMGKPSTPQVWNWRGQLIHIARSYMKHVAPKDRPHPTNPPEGVTLLIEGLEKMKNDTPDGLRQAEYNNGKRDALDRVIGMLRTSLSLNPPEGNNPLPGGTEKGVTT